MLPEVLTLVPPETLLKWHRQLVARKWDFSRRREGQPGRPSISVEIATLVLQFARENPSWGSDRIVGALANVGPQISDQTVGKILKRHGLGPAPERKRNTTWAAFIRRHKAVLWATDFFTTEVWTPTGLTTFYVLFFLQLQTRKMILGGPPSAFTFRFGACAQSGPFAATTLRPLPQSPSPRPCLQLSLPSVDSCS